jgi:hypothetical protein
MSHCKDPDCKELHYKIGLYKYHYKAKTELIKTKKYVIKSMSYKQYERLKKYRVLRDEFFVNNPICMFPNCNSKEIQLHHSRGRIGALLTDVRYFKSLCNAHHSLCELNPLEAQNLGLSYKRLDK